MRFIIFILSFASIHAFSQVTNLKSNIACKPQIFTSVENNPYYSGTLSKLEQDLSEILRINTKPNQIGVYRLLINCKNEMVVDTVLKSIDKATDNLIIEGLNSLQNWNAGKQKNKTVDCYYFMPIKSKNGRPILSNK